jgi:hypothetical protein
MRTSPAQYRQAHELPGWYPRASTAHPGAAWTAGDAEQDFHAACARLVPGPAVLRDYVKSMKPLLARGRLHPRHRRPRRRLEDRGPVPRAARGRVHRRLRTPPLRAVHLRGSPHLVGRRHLPPGHRPPRHPRRPAPSHRPTALHPAPPLASTAVRHRRWPCALTGPGGSSSSTTARSATARRAPTPPHSSTPSSPRNQEPPRPAVPRSHDPIRSPPRTTPGQGPCVAPFMSTMEAGHPSRCRCPFGQVPRMQSWLPSQTTKRTSQSRLQ